MIRLRHIALASLLLAGCSASSDPTSAGPSPDAENASIAPPGKADSTFSSCQVAAALLVASDPVMSADALRNAGVHSRAAGNIARVKAGADGIPGTEDDVSFHTLPELDAVPWVGPVALRQLAENGAEHCQAAPEPAVSVIFSPQPTRDTSHLARAAEIIDSAKRSIDVAMYSFSDAGILDALGRAQQRGVSIRFIYDPAGSEAKNPAGTKSEKIEQLGIDVRYVNKIMHNKFMIVDGPREDVLDALDATVMTGSANWSNSAGTRYDENTAELHGAPALTLRFQREFNRLWTNSRDFDAGAEFQRLDSLPVSDWMMIDDENADVAFTSANFDTFVNSYGPGFTVVAGRNEVADRMVELIQSAKSSIWLASAHLRSRPVAEALLERHQQDPNLDIRVYLDGQEYVSASTSSFEAKKLDSCVAAAGDSESKKQSCFDKDFHWSYPVAKSGIALRFKNYSYRWHYSYALQMHHKYMLVDGNVLASGSYNLSDNAEHATMDNLVIYRGGAYASMAKDFETNFAEIWDTGIDEQKYASLLDEVENGTGDVPIVYDSMALDWQQVTDLKSAIRTACTDVDSTDFRTHPEKHYYCHRQ
jgi:phosphatidylserine/phosphatidylglycerophosphate/cardiolipin synthase-like enzyme